MCTCEHCVKTSVAILSSHCLLHVADYIHYGEDIGIEASLCLDSCNDDVLNRRKEGHEYLASKLNANASTASRGKKLTSQLVDCRFALAKVCMPLMRELEFSSSGTRNFITSVEHRKQGENSNADGNEEGAIGMLQVNTEGAKDLMYVGNDAVHTLGMEAFHVPIQREINKRMQLENDKGADDSKFRFTPISLTPALEKNVDLILGLTGMDQVRSYFECLSIN